MMFGVLLSQILGRILCLALHLESSSFPKPLHEAEERQAILACKAGDKAARDKLIQHNLRLVAHIAKKYYAGACEQEDLISIGTVGLIKAVESFKVEKGARFSTYAARCIENEMLMTFRTQKKTKGTLSLSDAIDAEDAGSTLQLGDLLTDGTEVFEKVETREEKQHLQHAMQTLEKRQQKIITMRYGLNGGVPCTQYAVAQALGISRSFVSRLEKKALLHLREAMAQETDASSKV